MLGNDVEARNAIQDSVAVRLKESIQAFDTSLQASTMAEDEKLVLLSMVEGVSYDISQLSSRATLTPSRVAAALTTLRGIGAIEILGKATTILGIGAATRSPLRPRKGRAPNVGPPLCVAAPAATISSFLALQLGRDKALRWKAWFPALVVIGIDIAAGVAASPGVAAIYDQTSNLPRFWPGIIAGVIGPTLLRGKVPESWSKMGGKRLFGPC